AREAANRAACLSNMRQLASAMIIYANQFKDQVPLGQISDEYQWNYTVNFANNTRAYVTHMGVLRDVRLLESPETFYCPSETDPQWQFATDQNPFPFVTVPSLTAHHTRLGFGTRPGWAWEKDAT